MIRKWASIACALFASIGGAYGAELRAHWDFENLKDNCFADKVSGLKASGPAGVDLRRFLMPGPEGTAVRFVPGKNPLRVEHCEALDLKDDFTVEVIFKLDASEKFRCIFWKGDRTKDPEQVNYHVGLRDGRPEFKVKGPQGKWVVRSCRAVVKNGEWNHLLMHWKDGKLTAKLNGAAVPVGEANGEELPDGLVRTPTPGFFGQGATPRHPTAFFAGELDDFKIWQGDAMENRIPDWDRKLADVKKRFARHREMVRKEAEAAKLALDRKIARFCGKSRFGYAVGPVSRRIITLEELFAKFPGQKAELELARNESETLQLFLFNAPSGKNTVRSVAVSALTGPGNAVIPASGITVGEVGSVTTVPPDIPVAFTGPIPDVIFAGKTGGVIPADGLKTFALRIFSGQAPAGLYRGKITVTMNTGVIEIPLTVRVWDFGLPKRTTLRTAFCFFEHFYRNWYGLKKLSAEQKRKIFDFLLDYRLSPCNIYDSGGDDPLLSDLKMIRERTNFMTLQSLSRRMTAADAVGKFEATLREAKKLNFEDHVYFYSYDELMANVRRLADAKRDLKLLREKIPDLKCMQTSFPAPAIRELFNVWCPLILHFADPAKRAVLEDLKRKGCEIWWYWADDPIKPLPNFFLDYPVFDCRIVGLLSHMYEIKGILYWCTNREWPTNMEIRDKWPDAAWKPYIYNLRTKKRIAKNGMGNLIYPGKNGELLPSLRLENLRDGIEDHEYLAILSRECAKLPPGHPLRKKAEALLKVPAPVAESVTRYSSDPENLQAYRRAVAEMIVKLKRGTAK
ncbi:MAG: DUF4091 domain-containing protein [Lentisphaeria bacterium]|nr:DUF4091 domain-containing protein [Lentisphaeria bacterium]